MQLQHLTPTDIAELDRQIEALAQQRKQEAAERAAAEAKRREALTCEFPIPPQAKEFVLDEEGDGLEITMPGGTGPAALAALREHFKEAGWEEDDFEIEGTSGDLTVKRGDSKLWIDYMSFDKEKDFELKVTCFGGYVKPVKVEEEGPSSSDGEEPKPES